VHDRAASRPAPRPGRRLRIRRIGDRAARRLGLSDRAALGPTAALYLLAASRDEEERGYGLIGLGERAILAGGKLNAERADGTFCLPPISIRRSSAVTRALIADDDDLMRAGLVEPLSNDPSIEIVGEAPTGRQAVERTRQLDPDVVLMDVRLPDLDGSRRLARTRATPCARVLILTTFEQDDYIFGALRAGASGLPAQTNATR
jgi:CheY-like chemotaxis protein